MCEFGVSSIGYGTVEDIPVFHVAPGGSALRVVLPASTSPPFECREWCGLLHELSTAAGSEESIRVKCSNIIELAQRWRVDVILIEGIEPTVGEALELLRMARASGFIVGLRTQSLRPACHTDEWLDFIVFDYMGLILDEPFYKVNALRCLEEYTRRVQVELNIYMSEPLLEPSLVPTERVSGRDAVHIHIGDPKGGGAARQVYETVRARHAYAYLHSPPYDRLDTYCGNCGALVAVREHSKLVALKTNNGNCWRCGGRLPFRGPLYERTHPRILRRSGGGGTRWHDPRVIAFQTMNS